MATSANPDDFEQTLLTHCRSIQSVEGDEPLREMLLAERAVTQHDSWMTGTDKTAWLEALDRIEAMLLPSPKTSSDNSPSGAAPA